VSVPLLWFLYGCLCLWAPHTVLGSQQLPWALSTPLRFSHGCELHRLSVPLSMFLGLFLILPPPHQFSAVFLSLQSCTSTAQSLFLPPPLYLFLPSSRVLTGKTGSRLWLGAGWGRGQPLPPPHTPAAKHLSPTPIQSSTCRPARRLQTPPQSCKGGGTWRRDQISSTGQEMRVLGMGKGWRSAERSPGEGAVVSIIRTDPIFFLLPSPQGLLQCVLGASLL
jgi:hypothetical protein